MNRLHKEILQLIRDLSGPAATDAFLDRYLGNDHPKYAINNPTLRAIAKDWMRAHKTLSAEQFAAVLTSLIEGKSCTEKMTAGFLMEYSTKAQRTFDPMMFDPWLDHLVGWVEVDTLCTGDFIADRLPAEWPKWKKLVSKLSKEKNVNKRRASLVLFCSPLGRGEHHAIADTALAIVERLKGEKEVMITKAVSWVLRSMIKYHRDTVARYLDENKDTLPKIAARETAIKLDTGRKSRH